MASTTDTERLQAELVDAVHECEEERARALVRALNAQPRKARALLEAMLEDEDARVRHAGAFGLGELGGPASARKLARQLTVEEARGTHDGASVIEALTWALSRIKSSNARATLVRRLERVVSAARPEPSLVYEIAYALWRQRHPDLIPAVRQSLSRHNLPAHNPLHGLLVLLEKSPAQLRTWAADLTVPVELKSKSLALLAEDLPESLFVTLPAFISTAEALLEPAIHQDGAEAHYCENLFVPLLLNPHSTLPSLPLESREALHGLARALVGARSISCAMKALHLLHWVGVPEDASLIEAHRPEHPLLAKEFDEIARTLRDRRPSPA